MSLGKARIIAAATALLDPAEARAAEQLVLDRAARLTPGGLRPAIARAVIEVVPDKARRRRETAARFARVERWAEDTGNAALSGRELAPDQARGPVRLRTQHTVRDGRTDLPVQHRPAVQAITTHFVPGSCSRLRTIARTAA